MNIRQYIEIWKNNIRDCPEKWVHFWFSSKPVHRETLWQIMTNGEKSKLYTLLETANLKLEVLLSVYSKDVVPWQDVMAGKLSLTSDLDTDLKTLKLI